MIIKVLYGEFGMALNGKSLTFVRPFVILLGLEPRTPTLKVLCSTG
jgi:hypothetical protein